MYLDLVADFPHAVGAFAAMRRYVRAVEQFSDFPSAQTATRLRAKHRRTDDPVRQGELEYQIEEAEHDMTSTVPRLVWGSLLLVVYATFETGVRNALSHWANQFAGAPPFKASAVGKFLPAAKDYSFNVIGVKLFADAELEAAVLELKVFRDSFAHSAGHMPKRQTDLHSTIAKARKRGYAVTIEDETWIANPRLVDHYLWAAERAYKDFSELVVEKYYIARRSSPES